MITYVYHMHTLALTADAQTRTLFHKPNKPDHFSRLQSYEPLQNTPFCSCQFTSRLGLWLVKLIEPFANLLIWRRRSEEAPSRLDASDLGTDPVLSCPATLSVGLIWTILQLFPFHILPNYYAQVR